MARKTRSFHLKIHSFLKVFFSTYALFVSKLYEYGSMSMFAGFEVKTLVTVLRGRLAEPPRWADNCQTEEML
jgi:hypothetical protein